MADGHMPAGTVSLLFTDIDGSTRLLEELGDAYATLLSDHHRLVSEAIAERTAAAHVDAAGDGLFISFPTARAALLACLDAQRAIGGHAMAGAAPSPRADGPAHR